MSAATYALRCRICEHVERPGPGADCTRCDGPTDIAYDLEALRSLISPARVAAGPPSVWRYRDLLPSEVGDDTSAVGWTPLIEAPRLSEALDLDVRLKIETANPTGSYKDRTAALAGAAARALGLETLCCSTTGNLGLAAAAEAAARQLEAIVLVPAADSGLLVGARTHGAQVIAIDGSYEDCRRLELELASLFPWGFMVGNLRPYAIEGAKTIAFEVAEQLGWRLPGAIVCPVASGALLAKIAQGFHELRAVGLVTEPRPRLLGAQPGVASSVASAYAEDRPLVPVRPGTSAYALAAYGDLAVGAARETGGAILAVGESRIPGYTELLADTTGVEADCAGGLALGALVDAVGSGQIKHGEQVVLVITGAPAPIDREPSSPGGAIPPRLDALLAKLGAA